MNLHKGMVIVQVIFIVGVVIGILMIYPRIDGETGRNGVEFKSITGNAIILSSSPDFSNSRYVEINDTLELDLEPGIYYWKPTNGIINGFVKEFEVDSEVGLSVDEDALINSGNVKVNVTETEDGSLVGYIILDPEESSEIKNENETLVGRQND